MPQARVAALRADPERSRRLSVNPTGTLLFLVLGTHKEAGAIADVRVRQAVNYAIDKVAYRDALAGRFAATGELASTILAPGSLGYRPTTSTRPRWPGRPRQGQSPAGRGRLPQRADPGLRDLRQRQVAAARKPIEESLAKAGIDLKVTTYRGVRPHFDALRNPAKRLEHQLGQTSWARTTSGTTPGDDRAAVRQPHRPI